MGGIMDEILREATQLAQDQYGNYVVQHVLQHGGEEERPLKPFGVELEGFDKIAFSAKASLELDALEGES